VLPAAAGQRRVRRRVSQAARVVRLQGLGVAAAAAAAAAAAVVGRVGQATAAGPLQPTSFLVQVLGLGVQILGRRHRHVRVAARVHLLQVLQTLSQEVLRTKSVKVEDKSRYKMLNRNIDRVGAPGWVCN
jgi:hypothetical protein